MDAKSLAKSKRAHTLHHSKKHHPSSRATSAASGKKVTEKLPSNWDRFDSETEELPNSASDDTVVPKSKGADFAHLIAEAKSQSEPSSSACFADEVLNGIYQGPGELLFAEGQRLLASISDYSFPFGEKETRSHEESFFSLDLQSLAEQLSKASLVERLFIEPDIFPPELLFEYEATLNIDATEIALDRRASNSMSNKNSAPISVNQLVDDFSHSGSSTEKLAPDVQTSSVAKRPSRFVSTAAESELDMLLDSFSETKLFDPTSLTERPSYTSSKAQASVSVQDSGKGSHLANMGGVNSSLDDSLDDLLKETSYQFVSTSAKGALPVKEGPDSRNSGILNNGLDESLDDLLKETSNRTLSTITKAELSVQEVNVVTSRTKTSTTQPSSKSKILDDFDSWFDSV